MRSGRQYRQDDARTWLLWIWLVGKQEGLEAGTEAARVAIKQVAPAKNLDHIYRLLGEYLCDLGRVKEAVESLLEGAERSATRQDRLIQQALVISAAEASSNLLARVRERVAALGQFERQVQIADVLHCEHRDHWHEGVDRARRKRDPNSRPPLFLILHEALCLLRG